MAKKGQRNSRLAIERRRRGWTQNKLVDAMYDIARDRKLPEPKGLDANYISRYERGVTVPSPHHVHLMCLAFDLSSDRLGFDDGSAPSAAGELQSPPGAPKRRVAPALQAIDAQQAQREQTSSALVAMPGLVTLYSASSYDPDDVERREFIQRGLVILGSATRTNLPAALLSPLAEGLDLQTFLRGPLRMRAGRISIRELEDLEACVRILTRTDASNGGVRWRNTAISQLRLVTDALDYRYPADLRGRLLNTVADLAQLTAWMSYDSGDFASAHQSYLFALDVCRQAGDDVLRAKVLGDMAQLANALGHHHDELFYMQQALASLPPAASPFVRSELYSLQARAYALLGQELETERSLHDSLTLASNPTDSQPVPGWAEYLNSAEVSGLAANVRIHLALKADNPRSKRSHIAQAESHVGVTLGSRDQSHQRSRVLDLIRLAHVRLIQSDAAEAAVVAFSAVETARDMTSHLVLTKLVAFHSLLSQAGSDHTAVKQFSDGLREYSAERARWEA